MADTRARAKKAAATRKRNQEFQALAKRAALTAKYPDPPRAQRHPTRSAAMKLEEARAGAEVVDFLKAQRDNPPTPPRTKQRKASKVDHISVRMHTRPGTRTAAEQRFYTDGQLVNVRDKAEGGRRYARKHGNNQQTDHHYDLTDADYDAMKAWFAAMEQGFDKFEQAVREWVLNTTDLARYKPATPAQDASTWISWTLRLKGSGTGRTVYPTVDMARYDDAVSGLAKMVYRVLNEYDAPGVVSIKMSVRRQVLRPAGQGGKNYADACRKWHIANKTTRTNCGYTAFVIATCPDVREPTAEAKEVINQRAKDLKRDVKAYARKVQAPFNESAMSEHELQLLADWKKCNIIVYDNTFDKCMALKTRRPVGRGTAQRPDVELQLVNNHFLALWRKTAAEVDADAAAEIMSACRESFEESLVKDAARKLQQFSACKKTLGAKGYKSLRDTTIDEAALELGVDPAQLRMRALAHMDRFIPAAGKGAGECNMRIASYDLETCPESEGSTRHTCYAAGLAYRDADGRRVYVSWIGLDAIHHFLEYLADHAELLSGYTFFGHNAGRFDARFLLREGLLDHARLELEQDAFCETNGRIMRFVVCSGEHQFTFHDSAAIVPGSLAKMLKDFDTPHQKLTELVSHRQITVSNFMSHRKELERYLHNDVQGLQDAMEKLADAVYSQLHINIHEFFSAAGISKLNFYRNHYDPDKYPLYTLSQAHDDYLRQGYFAGRCEAFQLGYLRGRFNYHDFTSLFPAVGCRDLPYGAPRELTMSWSAFQCLHNPGGDPPGFFGFTDVWVRSKPSLVSAWRAGSPVPKQLHVAKNDAGRNTYRMFPRWTRLPAAFSEVIRRGLKTGLYDYSFETPEGCSGEPCKALAFRRAPFMKACFTEAFLKKQQAHRASLKTIKALWKLVACASYGFFGLKLRDRDTLQLLDCDSLQIEQYLRDGKLKSVSYRRHNALVRITADIPPSRVNVAIAVAITAYGQMELFDAMSAVEATINPATGQPHRVFYCDTDSMISDCDVHSYPHLAARFNPTGTGEELGELKDEVKDWVKDAVKAGEVEEGADDNSFQELVLLGPKWYGCRKTCTNGHVIEVVHQKGYHNPDQDDIEEAREREARQAAEGVTWALGCRPTDRVRKLNFDMLRTSAETKTPIISEQTRFWCSKDDMMKDDERCFQVRVGKTTLTNRWWLPADTKKNIAARPAYSKGVVDLDTLRVRPLCD